MGRMGSITLHGQFSLSRVTFIAVTRYSSSSFYKSCFTYGSFSHLRICCHLNSPIIPWLNKVAMAHSPCPLYANVINGSPYEEVFAFTFVTQWYLVGRIPFIAALNLAQDATHVQSNDPFCRGILQSIYQLARCSGSPTLFLLDLSVTLDCFRAQTSITCGSNVSRSHIARLHRSQRIFLCRQNRGRKNVTRPSSLLPALPRCEEDEARPSKPTASGTLCCR